MEHQNTVIDGQIELKDIPTNPALNKLFYEECNAKGLKTSLYTYVFGIIGIPLALRNFHKRIPIPMEYKLAIGAVSAMILSFASGTYVKKRCEKNLKRELAAQLSP